MTRARKIIIGTAACAVSAGVAWPLAVRPALSSWVRTQFASHVERHFDGRLAVTSFDVSLFPRIRVEGTGLALTRNESRDGRPLIAAKSFAAVTSIRQLYRGGLHTLTITGLTIYVAPDGEPSISTPKVKRNDTPPSSALRVDGLRVDEIVATDAHLEIAADDPAGLPLVFEIEYAKMQGFAPDHPASYEARLTNPKPRGEIVSSGRFGPWRTDAPRLTHVSGLYSLQKADMSVFPGIGGTMDSTGNFTGVLGLIAVNGSATLPDFQLDTGGHPMRLETSFSARVDGTNGNTYLDRVTAKLGNSPFTAKGAIAGTKTSGGKTIRLDVRGSAARLEDFIYLVVSETPSPMKGALSFQSALELPPGDRPVIEVLRLSGTFALQQGRFASDLVQDKVDELSRRGRGAPKDQSIENVLSAFSGTYTLRDGVLALPRFQFDVRGARVMLAGRYALRGERLDFTGELRLQAKVSQTTTGIKSVLLRVVDPFFRKHGAGAVLPIRISGSVSEPEFKLNLFRRKG